MKFVVAATIPLGTLCLRASAAMTANERPNILFIYLDDLGYGDISCYNPESKIQTPNFDRVAAMGVRFTNAYVQSPICGASRMSYYTGRYVRSHGSTWNNFPLRVLSE